MKCKLLRLACGAILRLIGCRFAVAQEIYMSYPGLTGESAPLWIARETGILKEYGIDANLVYMEGGRLSIQSLLSGTTQFMTGDAVSALSAVAGGKAIKNTLEISQRVAPKLAGIDIKRYLYFALVQRLADEGFIERLYK